MAFLGDVADSCSMANIWVRTLAGELIRHDRIIGLSVHDMQEGGWTVFCDPGGAELVPLAALGRGWKAQDGAERLILELPHAIETARRDRQGITIEFIKTGYPKGGGQWSNLIPPEESGPERDASWWWRRGRRWLRVNQLPSLRVLPGMADKNNDGPYQVGCFVIVVLALLIGGGIWAWNALFGAPSAHYEAVVLEHSVVNPATLSVGVGVTDTGKGAGVPQCTIGAQDSSGTYKGFGSVTLKNKLEPGQDTTFTDDIVITHQGAQYVTEVTVSCS